MSIAPERRKTWTINGRFLSQSVTGVQRYAREILAALDDLLSHDSDLASRLTLRLALPPGVRSEPSVSSIDIYRTQFGSGHYWDQLVLPLHAKSGVLSLGNFGPAFARNHITCIHDANVFVQPESYSRSFRLAYRTLLPLIGRRAKRVGTVSQYSADMLIKHSICRPEQIFIAPNGHEHALRWDAIRAKPLISPKRPYILVLGSRAKHKNIEIILGQAKALDEAGISIVVAGGAFSIFSASAPDQSHPNIYQRGYVSDDELAALYEDALCLVFPSRTEGFGLPPLEAMTRGCPVVCSNIPSLVEVGGDAALYLEPDEGYQWRDTIIGLSGNEGLRAQMSERGRRRAQLFSWSRSAQIYVEEIQRLEVN
jgi:glycosyltransferase involved in cell wall biosynthesis